jgi:predicted TIM-barrel fold metal-dependent hydrolase
VVDYYEGQNQKQAHLESGSYIMKSLLEIGPKRLKVMDSGGVGLQVVSHRPNTLALPPEVCRAANDELCEAIKSSPDANRFAAFAMLPTAHPDEAAKELARCVEQLGFVGSLIDNTTNGRFYDDEFFWPIFAAHESLGVPVYLHPSPTDTSPSDSPFHGNYDPFVSNYIANYGFNWHAEVGLHVLRLFAAKLFDKHTHLKLIIGHMGELLPYQLDRIHRQIKKTWPLSSRPQRHLLQVWHENLYITTSGMFSLAPMACLIHMCTADKVLYSVDYPFSSNEEGLQFMISLRESGMINDEDFASIAYRNAERLLGVRVPEGNDVGISVDVDDITEANRLKPWLSDGSNNERDGDVPFPYSPLETVRE